MVGKRPSGSWLAGLIAAAAAALLVIGSAAGQERQSQQDRLRTGGPGGGLTEIPLTVARSSTIRVLELRR